MSSFYNKFIALCARDGKSPSAGAKDVGFSRAAPNGWKNGKAPQDVTIAAVAAYFGVPTSYFTGDSASDILTPVAQKTPADMEQLFTAATDEQKIEWAARLISSLSDNQQAALIQRIMFKK